MDLDRPRSGYLERPQRLRCSACPWEEGLPVLPASLTTTTHACSASDTRDELEPKCTRFANPWRSESSIRYQHWLGTTCRKERPQLLQEFVFDGPLRPVRQRTGDRVDSQRAPLDWD